SEVERTDREGVATLTLNRPESLNALSPQLFVELRAHVDAIAKDTDGIGCVILCGAGKSFSSGNDLRAIQAGETAPTPEFQAETLDAIEAMPQPVVAAVRGHCYTGALEVVLACDLLIASDSAKFSDTHGKWGMTPTWGMSQRLPRRVLDARAAELAAAIAANSWYTLRADKQLVNEGQRYTLADGLAFERANSFGATPDTMKRLKEFGGRKKKS
ncbi:MAG: enoyl-CoA hydratase/isomerase family protein, partial [Deltaproteobacteria bacterium]|nr:enoyl-CoA hydratase/isomerase family protein [Deltaproteobacteria bacterium]